ncbi:sialate O-acetylesterase [Pedobacter hiemivivus]|uniref:Sialate O-acetylesterase n=2 Tax=Pedobacter hiemivivus TaxID=2530454 RepID=A0A4R0MR13_9SPHI|nr:sialate O-acetylesterase [Pedobacter hiemivivus]
MSLHHTYMRFFIKLAVFFWLLLFSGSLHAQLRIPGYFSDHMVLQRAQPVKIWGWANAGSTANVTFNSVTYTATVKDDGTWSVNLPVTKAGGPYDIKIVSAQSSIILKDVLFGDVWFCSGQSNMNFRMSAINNFAKEKEDADYPWIRQLDANRLGAEVPQKNVAKSTWVSCSPATIQAFSAVAFCFAKELYVKNKVPIGIINASWGGSPIQTFMSPAALKDFPEYKERIDAITPTFINDLKQKYKLENHKWALKFYALTDYISQDLKLSRDPAFFDTSDWLNVRVPGYLEQQGLKVKNGVSWYKKEFVLDELPEQDVNVDLGRIKMSCVVFINGQFVGRQFSIWYNANYKIPKAMLKKGGNEILVCSYNENGSTGFQPVYKPKLVINTAPQQNISLEGTWLFKQGKTYETPGVLGPLMPLEYFEHQYPTLVYNAVIAPFFNYGVKGVLWYQGEDNAKNSVCYDYEKMLSNLISDWRTSFNAPKLPFLIVQLANFNPVKSNPEPSAWTIVQEAQAKVGQGLKNAGTVVINDIGDVIDIHPKNKQDVGKRLALLARKIAYGENNITASGPEFKSAERIDDRLIISYNNVGAGLVNKDGTSTLKAFCLAGKDSKFYRANASIDGDRVIVFSDQVKAPLYVRYAFEDNPGKINFYNKDGLPAVPFRTDTLKIK